MTGVIVPLSKTMTNAVILRTECTRADIDWRGSHKWEIVTGPPKIKAYLHHTAPVFELGPCLVLLLSGLV